MHKSKSPHALKTLIDRRQQLHQELHCINVELLHRAAAAIQGGYRIRLCRRRLTTEKSLRIIAHASQPTLTRWLNGANAHWFRTTGVATIAYKDYRLLVGRFGVPLTTVESQIQSLAGDIHRYQNIHAVVIQRRIRGMHARGLYQKLHRQRINRQNLRNQCACTIQRFTRGHFQRIQTKSIALKRFEQKLFQSYLRERQIDKGRRILASQRSRLMAMYGHERREELSRRMLLGLKDEGDLKRTPTLKANGEKLIDTCKSFYAGKVQMLLEEMEELEEEAARCTDARPKYSFLLATERQKCHNKNDLIRSYNAEKQKRRMLSNNA